MSATALHHPHRLSRKQANRFLLIGFALFVALEGLAALHLYIASKDVLTAGLIVGGWFKESLKMIVEHIVESAV